jgi:GDP-D-mannose dehydratase
MPTCLITGVTGQDGAYLSQLLLQKDYRVIGMMRRSASSDTVGERLRWLGILDDVELVVSDLSDLSSLIRLMQTYQPDEVYNLAAQSFVAVSWDQPLLTTQVGADRPAAGTLLPGVIVRDVRSGSAATTERGNAVLSTLAVCGRQALRALDDGELPRELRHACHEWDPVQS